MTAGAPALIAIVGPFPPPMHGEAAITAAVAELLARRMTVLRCDNSPGTLARGLPYHMKRLSRFVAVLAKLLAMRSSGSVVYLAAAGGFGLVYDVFYLAVARLKGCRAYVHHHSFAYLDRRSAVMALLARIGGGATTHIALCDRMAGLLRERYGVRETLTLDNMAFQPSPAAEPAPAAEDALRLGHMSNLCEAKGLDTVIELFRACRAAGLQGRLVLAGPAADARAAELIAAARAEFGADCDYRGPVYGEDKRRFFSEIDVFLFPSRYVNEAQPIVLFEAMAQGVPSIAAARGCISEQLEAPEGGERSGVALPGGAAFVAAALAVLREWAASPPALAAAKDAARARAGRLHAMAARQLEAFRRHAAGDN